MAEILVRNQIANLLKLYFPVSQKYKIDVQFSSGPLII